MIKINSFKLILGVILSFCFVLKVNAQHITYITLQNQKLNVTPKEFYIAGVEDARADKKQIGSLQSFPSVKGYAGTYKIDLSNGTIALENFIKQSLPVYKYLRPVVLKLKTLNVTESPAINGVIKGSVNLFVSFYLHKGEELVHLVDHNTKTSYQRAAGPAQQIEPLLRNALGNSIIYFNTWVNAQAGSNIKLAKSVKLILNDYIEPGEEGDTIYYNVNRPLKWADFTGKPPAKSKHAAEVFPGIGFDERVKVENSIVKITLAIKVYAPKSACWATPSIINNESLNHEQRHFDIAKLVGEHLKQKLRNEQLPTDNYDGNINVIYFDALRELDKIQKQYDAETSHSNNTYQQQLWNARLDKELVELGVKKSNL